MLKKSVTLILLLAIAQLTFSQPKVFVDTVFNNTGTKYIKSIFQYTISGSDTLKEGPASYYYSNGTIWQTGYYHNNLMDSIWTTYDPTGVIKRKVQYENGLKNGPFANYYRNGKVQYEGTYRNDSLTGEMKLYDSQGRLTETRMYEGHKLNGMVTGYWPNGNLHYRFEYADSIKHGIYEKYYDNGQLQEKATINDPYFIG